MAGRDPRSIGTSLSNSLAMGPVLAPVSIALLMIVGGTLASQTTVRRPATSRAHWELAGAWASCSRSTCSWPTRFELRITAGRGDRAANGVQLVGLRRGICFMAAPVARAGWRLRPSSTPFQRTPAAGNPVMATDRRGRADSSTSRDWSRRESAPVPSFRPKQECHAKSDRHQ